MAAEAVPIDGEPYTLPMEFIQLPVVHESSLDVPSLQSIDVVQASPNETRERLRMRGKRGNKQHYHQESQLRPRNDGVRPKPVLLQPIRDASELDVALFTTHGKYGILDTGATMESFLSDIQKQLRRTQCEITFRFGNQGTLDSQHALVVPFQSFGLGLKIAIVPGETPLLLPNTLARTLKASIDSAQQILTSPLLGSPVPLKRRNRGLYMLDINDLIHAQRGQHRVKDLKPAETFFSSDLSEGQNTAAMNCGDATTDATANSQVYNHQQDNSNHHH